MDCNALFEEAAQFYRALQDEITRELERLEGAPCFFREAPEDLPPARFREDEWSGDRGSSELKLGGGGRTRVLENGRVFEKAGVNWSDVQGEFSDQFKSSLPGESRAFRASGVSLVLHPRNPEIPTVHANFRVIRRGTPEDIERMWFGGGADLTPYYLYEEDAVHFHKVWRDACAAHPDQADYATMKRACDEYFFLPHRGEARGIGGIFYDYRDEDLEELFAFSRTAGGQFLKSFAPIVERRMQTEYGPEEREWQLWRRGRYVEFNLIHDRGTVFGLRTGGRIESILMSLPPYCAWKYDYRPAPDSREERLRNVLQNPVDWLSLESSAGA